MLIKLKYLINWNLKKKNKLNNRILLSGVQLITNNSKIEKFIFREMNKMTMTVKI
jgi:hypothetical protein